ncbi:CLUMA_CG019401, isoform A [Clunio marinus]|uniref:CLUMA_CG019401, isoform A n=1 Tax=Clunio marinus TaxID=568069 RepID=A0A1J1J1B7_9DIPT|nr:CLUMA_CG019401, isoform A [Clunio marinus]
MDEPEWCKDFLDLQLGCSNIFNDISLDLFDMPIPLNPDKFYEPKSRNEVKVEVPKKNHS